MNVHPVSQSFGKVKPRLLRGKFYTIIPIRIYFDERNIVVKLTSEIVGEGDFVFFSFVCKTVIREIDYGKRTALLLIFLSLKVQKLFQ